MLTREAMTSCQSMATIQMHKGVSLSPGRAHDRCQGLPAPGSEGSAYFYIFIFPPGGRAQRIDHDVVRPPGEARKARASDLRLKSLATIDGPPGRKRAESTQS